MSKKGLRMIECVAKTVFADQSPLTRTLRRLFWLSTPCSCSLRRVLANNAVDPCVPCSDCCGGVLPEIRGQSDRVGLGLAGGKNCKASTQVI
jgi:hypothetical protein